MPDEMFFSTNDSSLKRGRRVAKRTETCRPCLLWPKDAPEIKLQGVAMDVTPHGMLVRMIDQVPAGTVIMVQLMRDEDFEVPLAPPAEGAIVRNTLAPGGFTDHGVRLEAKEIKRAESKPVEIKPRRSRPTPRTRMHTIDITIGERDKRSEK